MDHTPYCHTEYMLQQTLLRVEVGQEEIPLGTDCQGEHLDHCSPLGGPCTTMECGYAVTHLDLSFQSGYSHVPLSLCKIHCGALRTAVRILGTARSVVSCEILSLVYCSNFLPCVGPS